MKTDKTLLDIFDKVCILKFRQKAEENEVKAITKAERCCCGLGGGCGEHVGGYKQEIKKLTLHKKRERQIGRKEQRLL
jgi:hypothetical protein